MNTEIHKPPPVIHSARTLFYAVNDESVEFTGGIDLFVGNPKNMNKLGEMPFLAICQNYCPPQDILLFFCDQNWEPQGAIGLQSIEAAKEKAEKGYKGISKNWATFAISNAEVNQFLREEYEVDPNTEWWRHEYPF